MLFAGTFDIILEVSIGKGDRKMKKIFSMLLAIVMMCTLFAGCGDDAVIKVGGREFTEDTYLASVAYANMYLSNQTGTSYADALDEEFDGKKGIDILKEQAEDLLKQMEASRKVAKSAGISLDDADKKMLDDQKKADVESMGGRKIFIEDLEAQGLNEEFYDYMMESSLLYSKFSQSFDVSPAEVVSIAEQGGYVRVKHVLVMTAEGGSDVEAKKALATEIAAKASAGEDFDALIKQYGEDPGMESMPHGYIIDQNGYTMDGQSQMMKEFTDGSISLEIGGVSAPVQTSYGFHIIKRYPIDEASLNDATVAIPASETNPEDITVGQLIKYEFMDTALAIRLMDVEQSIKIEKLDGFGDVDVRGFFRDIKKKQANVSHEGHNH